MDVTERQSINQSEKKEYIRMNLWKKVALIRYFENIIQFTVDLSETNELTKRYLVFGEASYYNQV